LEYLDSLRDKRTKNYKDISPLLDAHKQFFIDAQKQPAGVAWMMAYNKTREIGFDHFLRTHEGKYLEIYKMVSIKKNHYQSFLAKLSLHLHDEFCSCDQFEFKESPTIQLAESMT